MNMNIKCNNSKFFLQNVEERQYCTHGNYSSAYNRDKKKLTKSKFQKDSNIGNNFIINNKLKPEVMFPINDCLENGKVSPSNKKMCLNNTKDSLSKQVNYTRYKTELCRQFNENGTCKYGEKCQFAHGYNELKIVNRHPKYKTEFCSTFHSTGFCSYGPRCNFIHEPSSRAKVDSLVKNANPPSSYFPIQTEPVCYQSDYIENKSLTINDRSLDEYSSECISSGSISPNSVNSSSLFSPSSGTTSPQTESKLLHHNLIQDECSQYLLSPVLQGRNSRRILSTAYNLKNEEFVEMYLYSKLCSDKIYLENMKSNYCQYFYKQVHKTEIDSDNCTNFTNCGKNVFRSGFSK